MPELPEVETIRAYLSRSVIGKKIAAIKILSPKQLIGGKKPVLGAKIIRLGRAGKQLLVYLDNGYSLIIHLKLTGQLVFVPHPPPGKGAVFRQPIPLSGGNRLPGRSTRIIIYLNNKNGQPAGTLFFNDLRKFGWIKVVKTDQVKQETASLGPDALSRRLNEKYLASVLSSTRRKIKTVLLDQKKIAGIGNIYANDALFEAGVFPGRPANSLSKKEIKKLLQAVKLVLKQGIAAGGASAADEAYIKPNGEKGGYQRLTRVYQKNGQNCPVCGGKIKRIKLDGRGTFFCPRCQKQFKL